VADFAPLASAAALAAFLAALLLFFPPGGVVAAALDESSAGCCTTGSLESSSVATPSALGVAGRVALVAGSDPSGSVESARQLSPPLSDIASGLV
jgi:hypothetical protein